MIGGAVLCGGRSSRMGNDKAFVDLNGVQLAVRTATVLAEAGCTSVVLTGRQPALARLGLPVVADADVGFHHPLLGVSAALRNATTSLVLFAPCDVINLRPSHLEPLLGHGGPCVTVHRSQVHPLLCVIAADQAERALQFARDGRSAKDFVFELPRIDVPLPALTDANSPEDLAR